MAAFSISHDDVIDAEFETVFTPHAPSAGHQIKKDARPAVSEMGDQLALLRDQFDDGIASSQPDALSPLFLMVTLFCAFVVFWVSGGHRLLY
jgi:hypothetical protein